MLAEQSGVKLETGSRPSDPTFTWDTSIVRGNGITGRYDPKTDTIWINPELTKSEQLVVYYREYGHRVFDRELSEQDKQQWNAWFQQPELRIKNGSRTVQELFAEHYKLYMLQKISVIVFTEHSWKVISGKYEQIFPAQNQWFQNFGTKGLSARKK